MAGSSADSVVDILVLGAAMAGLTSALAFGKAGFQVTVLETRPALLPYDAAASDSRTTALAAGSIALLERYGLWSALRAQAAPIRHIHIQEPGRLSDCHFAAPDADTPMGFIVFNQAYTAAARAVLQELPNVRLETAHPLTAWSVEEDRVRVTSAEGERFQARLVVAADGKHSAARRLAGIRQRRTAYRQSALTGIVHHAKPHHGWAWEQFHATGPLAMLPLPSPDADTQASCYVWTVPDAVGPGLCALPDALFQEGLQAAFGTRLGALTLAGPRRAYPLEARLADRLIAPRLALVADAGHVLHPLAGQGFNVGLRDIDTLCQQLTAHAAVGLDIGDATVLRDYERRRWPDIFSMYAATDGLNRLFQTRWPLMRPARGVGLATVDRVPWLKDRFVRHAMGQSRLARGG